MGNVFMWNGEVFGGYDSWPIEISDTSMLSNTLEACIAQSDSIYSGIVSVMTRIQGPYAFIYYHALSRTIFYGRDPFGRRSLLTYKFGNAIIALSSVSTLANGGQWEEVGIGGVYSLSLDTHDVSSHPWPEKQLRLARYPHNALMRPSLQPSVDFLEHLNRSVVKRLRRCHHTHPISLPPAPASSWSPASASCKVAVLFSGGIDSLLLAAMLHISLCFMHCSSSADSAMSLLDEIKHMDTVGVIELLNIVFVNEENDTAPDRLAALAGLSELQVRAS
jgi:asparagine synthetase B (glutamine-hydrolysing)